MFSIPFTENVSFARCDWEEFSEYAARYYTDNRVILDSFLEDHLVKSNHYRIELHQEPIGYFSIFEKTTLVFFHVSEEYACFGQELFARVKKCETVTNAMVPTGDEFFLSHAADAFTRIEKQAYFAVYTDKTPQKEIRTLELRLADIEADGVLFDTAGDFFDEDIQKIKNGGLGRIYVAESEDKPVGFGIIDPSLFLPYASIGMYVLEACRQQGYARSILWRLKEMARTENRQAISGCWYYNHNSKKSMESAGAYSKTRLLRFYF